MKNIKNLTPVFVCGHRASGGGLYMGLLDFHPELLVFPHESKFFFLFFPFMLKKSISPQKKINHIVENNLEFLKSGFFDNCHADPKYFNFKLFVKKFKKYALSHDSWESYLLSIFQALLETTPQTTKNIKYWIERSSSSEIYALEIIKKFPTAKFIHNIRDPRDNYASMKSRWEKKLKHLDDSASIEALRQTCIMRSTLGFDMGISNQKLIGKKNYIFTKYDNLVQTPEKELNKIYNFLNIKRKNIKLIPTFCGLKWPGNNFEGTRYDSISNNQSGAWRKRINDFEGALIEFHFKRFIEYFKFKLYYSESERLDAAREHYKWLNYESKWKADFKLATKSRW
jgi:hypothetical protein